MLSAPISIVVDEHTGSRDMANVFAKGYSIVGKEHCKSLTNNKN
jgi:hypothetical protein